MSNGEGIDRNCEGCGMEHRSVTVSAPVGERGRRMVEDPEAYRRWAFDTTRGAAPTVTDVFSPEALAEHWSVAPVSQLHEALLDRHEARDARRERRRLLKPARVTK